MKHKLILLILYLVGIIGILVSYFFLMINHVTFTQLRADPELTMKKYEYYWEDTTIVKEPLEKITHQSGDIIGAVTIPKLNIYEMPIYYGSDDENLNWQITTPGYEENWALFGEKEPTAIGAHNNQLFSQLDHLSTGDKLVLEYKNEVFVYEVNSTTVYNHREENWSEFVRDNAEEYAINLITCYPLQQFNSKDRYIVNAKMVRGTQYSE